ncbi:flagellar biosynthesis protein FlhA [Futiania mangrovi]|uniref:Flagellar biosynthesis protein FlhA n=1 Tax=Futiania mangrovi TaxID=2959716 RepID=A0A9J6P9X6_9PROT|nr:flagellar biosynthesis protein FlhA [Futiania mangrovii]
MTTPAAPAAGKAGFRIDPARALANPTVMVALALMTVITMMILPMPAFVLDMGLAISFALAILIFTITLFIERPLDFSSFPTILLGSLMLRLSLNVSSTKLIIGEGHKGTHAAGQVIEGFAMFVMGGSLFLGLVVFGVLLIVNFIVITKGAGRMAEVGARFALDGMPGRQLAIDADVASGAITHEEARERRKLEQEETTFFGSLDGASKFVKGDAIAGLLITLLNLVMGMAMGIAMHGLSFSKALETYAILTVGDGLVSQIPAVIVSVGAGLLLAKGGVTGATDKAIVAQMRAHPAALGTVAGLLAMFALVPGMPFVPFMAGAALLGGLAWVSAKRQHNLAQPQSTEPAPKAPEATLGDRMEVDDLHMEFAPDLVPVAMDEATGLFQRIGNIRRHLALEFGFVMPEVRLTDSPALAPGHYRILVQGVPVAQGVVRTDRVLLIKRGDEPLAIHGEDAAEPVYGAPARWIAEEDRAEAMALGLPVAAPNEVLATHLLETVKGCMGDLVTRAGLNRIVEAFFDLTDAARADAHKKLFDEFVPEPVSRDVLQAVLRLLLEERVSVRNLGLIIEAVAEALPHTREIDALAEHVRRRLSTQITAKLATPEGRIELLQLDPAWEDIFAAHETLQKDGRPGDVALPPDAINRLAASVGRKLGELSHPGAQPAIVTHAHRRRLVRTLLDAKGLSTPVLAFDEIGRRIKPVLVGTVPAA